MLATRTTTGLDLFLPPIVRFHNIDTVVTDTRSTFASALSFHQQATAQQAIDALRQMQTDIDSIYYLFVTDSHERLVGVINLRQLLCAAPGARLFEFMDRRLITLSPNATLREQARVMSETGLLALPVVDPKGRLVGAMDASDLIRAMEEESTTEMHHLAGIASDETLEQPPLAAAGYRSFWMLVNLVVGFLAAWILSSLSGVLTNMSIVAAFVPLLLLQSSQAARQTVAFVVRSLNLGQFHAHDSWHLVGRELTLGLVNGLLIAVLAALLGWLWQGSLALGLVLGGAMLGTTMLAALAGAGVPLTFKALHIDPTRASAAVVMAITTLSSLGLLCSLGALAL